MRALPILLAATAARLALLVVAVVVGAFAPVPSAGTPLGEPCAGAVARWMPGPLQEQIFGEIDPATWLPGMLFLATFLSEDLTCVGAGLLVANDAIGLVPATLACAAGIFCGDLGLYLLGRALALGLLRWTWVRKRAESDSASRWADAFRTRGARILFTTRFLPGTRMPAYLAAGIVGWSITKFAAIVAIAVLIWTPLLVWLATVSGEAVAVWLEDYGWTAWLVVPLVVLLIWLGTRTVPRLFSWRGRRELAGAWRRIVHWEYWPVWVVYTPVVGWLAILALRYRAFAVFTACNPSIPQGGIVLESKGEILDQLPHAPSPRSRPAEDSSHDDDDGLCVARYERLQLQQPIEERLARIADFLAESPSEPARCVLKPDEGERGDGVAIVSDLDAARRWLEACPRDAIVQEHVSGIEYGIVWTREEGGIVRSIARKDPPSVVGDGETTLERLVLEHPRHVAMASKFIEQHAERADEVPPAGAVVFLSELGTHARGAMFVDARELASEALATAIARFMADAPGLDFGRFDVRVPDAENLRRGRRIRVLEFNGVTGEPAHVYDPGCPLWRGIGELCAHWTAACRRGAANRARARGRPAGAFELLRLVAAMRRRVRFEAPGG